MPAASSATVAGGPGPLATGALRIRLAVGAIGVKGCDSKLLSFAVKIYVPFILIMGAIVYFGFSVLG